MSHFFVAVQNVTGKKQVYYIPKLDLVAGFQASNSIMKWLKSLADCVGNDIVYNALLFNIGELDLPDLFVQLISCEIETSNNKHLNDGVINMSRSSFTGILVATNNANDHLVYLQNNLGLPNVTYIDYTEI